MATITTGPASVPNTGLLTQVHNTEYKSDVEITSLSKPRSDSICTALTFEKLKTCEDTSTAASDSPLHRSLLRSTYHVYHSDERHIVISPVIKPSHERWWGPRLKEHKAEWKQRKLERVQRRECLAKGNVGPAGPSLEGSFFLYTPYLSFHDPPRVLYMGDTKYTKPAVLIQTMPWWRKYKLQLGPSIASPGLLDPRGVVCWRHNGGNKKALKADDRKLKGYKVKNWRLWGETGKEYVHQVNAERKASEGSDPDVLEDKDKAMQTAVRADEVVYLSWASPLSRNTRRYHFRYGGVDFHWKGTGTVAEPRRCGVWCRFNHLKLIAFLPGSEKGEISPRPEVCLAKYTSSVAAKKYGTLELYDGAIWRLHAEHMSGGIPALSLEDDIEDLEEGLATHMAAVKSSLLYQVIISTAMCMILGERQKRETVRKIIEACAGEAGGAAG